MQPTSISSSFTWFPDSLGGGEEAVELGRVDSLSNMDGAVEERVVGELDIFGSARSNCTAADPLRVLHASPPDYYYLPLLAHWHPRLGPAESRLVYYFYTYHLWFLAKLSGTDKLSFLLIRLARV